MDIKNFSIEDDLLVGHRAIDMQHTEFFKRLNTLIGAAVDYKNTREIQGIIRFLSDYIQKHLAMEERFMAKYDYPGAKAHKAQHDLFRRQYTAIMDSFGTGQMEIPEFVNALQKEVGEWFENHIRVVDREMASFLLANGGGDDDESS